jgi:gliding motility associated protien GldN
MKTITHQLMLISFIWCAAQAQPIKNQSFNENWTLDGVPIRTTIPTKRMIQYPSLREADVVWSKRIWRTIDLREKKNHALYYPHDSFDSNGKWIYNSEVRSLWSIFRYHLIHGDITLYSPYNPAQFTLRDGDEFKYPLLPPTHADPSKDTTYQNELFYYLGKLGPDTDIPCVTIFGEDSVDIMGNFVYPPRDTIWYTAKDIIQYRIKEDWYFDKARSVLDVRIIGIAPVIQVTDDDGNILGAQELFWLYFPNDCRYMLNNYHAFNPRNQAQWYSYDDLFWNRNFSSFIYKESNVYDRTIDRYRLGIDALKESQRIHEEMRLVEHDVWSF